MSSFARPARISAPLRNWRLRILIVDDHPVNRQVLSLLLAGLDAEIGAVEDGQTAIEACRTGDWDVVLMDIQMPRLDGLAATRGILAEAASAGRPGPSIVAVTTRTDIDQVRDCFRAGMIAHVAKPIDALALFEVLGQIPR